MPEGWNDWDHGCSGHSASGWCDSLTFAEFQSHGPGGEASKRVAWARQLSPGEAAAWNRTRVLRGWEPEQGVSSEAASAILARFARARLEAALGLAGVEALGARAAGSARETHKVI